MYDQDLMRKTTKELLISYADQYENSSFMEGDPSWFMHQVEGPLNQETMAFVASCLSYGSRKQFMPKIQILLDASKGSVYEWVASRAFEADIPDNQGCFYRLYNNRMMRHFLGALGLLLDEYGSLGTFAADAVKKGEAGHGDALKVLIRLAAYFKEKGLTGIVPQPVTSVCKRPCMFLRWMVRDNSPVDLGLWSESIEKSSLYIPMDTHVMQTARRLALIHTRTVSWNTAVALSKEMENVFPGDPARGDYALYGADVM